ncbi:MAG: metallophosphoesterase family protein [Pseudomonas fluorescens]
MFIIKNIRSMFGLLLCVVSFGVYSAQENYSPERLIFTSDPQFPWTESSDHGWEESSSDKEKRSRWLIETQYSDVADFRKNFNQYPGRIPVMINGDMTAFGHGGQRSTTKSILDEQLGGLYDYGLGNHDYENNVNDCSFPENNCAAGSIVELKDKYWGEVKSFDLAARIEGGTKIYYGSLAYSRSVGDVHLIQLNNEPTYSVNFSSGFFWGRVGFEVSDSLDWLERDMQRARNQGKIILLNMHKPDRWKGSPEQIARFKAMIKQYEVTAVFAGHLHNSPGQYYGWNRADYFGDVPVFLSGGASSQTYLIASFAQDRKTLTVHQVNGNKWPSRKAIETIKVR